MSQLVGLKEEVNETEYDESLLLIEKERKVEEVKMLSEVKEPLQMINLLLNLLPHLRYKLIAMKYKS